MMKISARLLSIALTASFALSLTACKDNRDISPATLSEVVEGHGAVKIDRIDDYRSLRMDFVRQDKEAVSTIEKGIIVNAEGRDVRDLFTASQLSTFNTVPIDRSMYNSTMNGMSLYYTGKLNSDPQSSSVLLISTISFDEDEEHAASFFDDQSDYMENYYASYKYGKLSDYFDMDEVKDIDSEMDHYVIRIGQKDSITAITKSFGLSVTTGIYRYGDSIFYFAAADTGGPEDRRTDILNDICDDLGLPRPDKLLE